LGCNNTQQFHNKPIEYYYNTTLYQQLAKAIIRNNVKRIDALIEEGANPNTIGKEGLTPLWLAYGYKNKKAMLALLHHGANPNYSHDGLSMLHMSAGNKVLDLAKLLLENNANPNIKTFDSKQSPIYSAIYHRDFELVKLLHQYGADINSKNKCDDTPIQLALGVRAFDIVFYLIENKAVLDNIDKNGGTLAWELYDSLENNLFSNQAKKNGLKLLQILQENGVEYPPLSPQENRERLGITEPCYN
jgi:ankyrin repeat protein